MRVKPELVNEATTLVKARTRTLIGLAGENPAALVAVATLHDRMQSELSRLRSGEAVYLGQVPNVRSVVLLDETQRAAAALSMGTEA